MGKDTTGPELGSILWDWVGSQEPLEPLLELILSLGTVGGPTVSVSNFPEEYKSSDCTSGPQVPANVQQHEQLSGDNRL